MPVKKGRLKAADAAVLERNLSYIYDEVDAQDLVHHLVSKGVFTHDDEDEIMETAGKLKRNRLLMSKMFHAGPGDAYDKFLEVIDEDYPHVGEKLREPVAVPSPEPMAVSSPESMAVPSIEDRSSQWSWFDELPDSTKNQPMSDRLASLVSSCFGDGWQHIFLQLGTSNVAISQQRARSPFCDTLVITNLLIAWRQRVVSEATLQALVNVLKETSCQVDIDRLKRKIES